MKRLAPRRYCNMRYLVGVTLGWLLSTLLLSIPAHATLIHHDLQVKLHPTQGSLSVIDDVQFPLTSSPGIEFILNQGLKVTAEGADLQQLGTMAGGESLRYRLTNLSGNRKVRLRYEGKIATQRPQGPFGMPAAILAKEGVYLDAASNWRPHFPDYPWLTFTLEVDTLPEWEIISQGTGERLVRGVRYTMPHPQDDIYLLGGRYHHYQNRHKNTELEVYLLEADAGLAQRYLQASAEYVEYYSQQIGPYPYGKFAVVENHWQTGYGMPSFTLLGSRVIRLPFILHTSLPHEILHNWWGNGVYIDASSGNWSEGLTAYMSDHRDSEQRGEDRAYRRKALERYANFAARGRDFPLAEFRSRHDDASQAVGYSKSLMLIHMLRRQLGDNVFNQRIRQFWQRYQFQTASYADLIETLLAEAKSDRQTFMKQWLYRPGAPQLALGKVEVKNKANGFQLKVEIRQTQSDAPYKLQVPLEVQFGKNHVPLRQWVDVTGRHRIIRLEMTERPQLLTLDPGYDVFRLLDPAETPSSLGRLFGARKQLLVLPTAVNRQQRQAWQSLATAWARHYQNVELIDDTELAHLPADSAVWILGWENRILASYQSRFNTEDQQLMPSAAMIEHRLYKAAEYASVLLDPDNSRLPLGFIGAGQPKVITALARKLPHYSSYGRLVFELPEVNNITKHSLPVMISPLTRHLGN